MFRSGFMFLCVYLCGWLPQAQGQGLTGTLFQERLKQLGAENAIIDMNVKVTLGPGDNPLSPESTTLWGSLVRPKEGLDQPLPTIVVATGYRRDVVGLLYLGLVPHGYNLLAIDNRGTGLSQGSWTGLDLIEQYDVKFIIDHWIPAQPWSDGKVGMIGASYMGIVQLLSSGLIDVDAEGQPVHLKAIMPLVSSADSYREVVFQGGNYNLEFASIWSALTNFFSILPPLGLLSGDKAPSRDDIELIQATLKEHLAQVPNNIKTALFDASFVNDVPGYYRRSPIVYWPEKPADGWPFPSGKRQISPRIPTLMTGGWYDIFTPGSLNGFQYGLQRHERGSKALIIGDWYHLSGALGLGLPSIANMKLAARWFDSKIKGVEDCFLGEYPVLMKVMGIDRWRAEKDWPLSEERTEARAFHLSRVPARRGFFSSWFRDNQHFQMGTEADRSKFRPDPSLEHRVRLNDLQGLSSAPTRRWTAGITSLPAEVQKFFLGKKDALWRADAGPRDPEETLLFSTEPLSEDLEIVGPLTLSFWARTDFLPFPSKELVKNTLNALGSLVDVQSNAAVDLMMARDIQWIAGLEDIRPDGKTLNVTEGWLRGTQRQNAPARADDRAGTMDPNYRPFDPFYRMLQTPQLKIEEDVVYPYVVELWPTAHVFKKGHRLRLTLAGSDIPHLLPFLQPSLNTLVINAEHPAQLSFKTTRNTVGEGSTWHWVDNPDQYLLEQHDECPKDKETH